MPLKEDVNAALEAMSRPDASSKLTLDDAGRCTVPVPMPPEIAELTGGALMINVEMSGTGRYFTLSSPIATVDLKTGSEFLRALLYRQFYADQVSGASFAIGGREDILVSVYHWALDSVSPDDFAELFKGFISASLDLIDEVGNMARRERRVKPLHKGRPG